MKIYGDIESISSSIKKKFVDDLEPYKKQSLEKITAIKKETDRVISSINSREKIRLSVESKKYFLSSVGQASQEAKREFDTAREKCITEVIEKARTQALSRMHTKKYLDFVKQNISAELKNINEKNKRNGVLVIKADSNYYKSLASKIDVKNIQIDNSLIGVMIESEDALYDFTFDQLLKSKEEKIRDKLMQVLFYDKERVVPESDNEYLSESDSTKISKKSVVRKKVQHI